MHTASLDAGLGYRQPTVRVLVAFVVCSLLAGTLPLGSRLAAAVASTAVEQPATLEALPAAAQAAISKTLGRDGIGYHVTSGGGALGIINARHALNAAFTPDGVSIAAGTETLGLRLRALGYGDALAPVASAIPTAEANRVTYARSTVTEWYDNGPLGLEQGFTLAAPPAVAGTGRLTLAVGLSGDFAPTLSADQRSLTLTARTASLRYTGLFAADAAGRELPASLELRGGDVLLRVDDTGARYPVTVDPFVQQGKLSASDGAAQDDFGRSVAISGDTIVVGAYRDDVGSNADQGSVYVFTKPTGGWATGTETAKLTASDGAASDQFGFSVAIASDTIVIGADLDNVGSNMDQGSAYVFTKPAGGWATGTETAKLTASDGAASDFYGYSVAVSSDAIVVGAYRDNVGSNADQGSAYVFREPAGGWATGTETAKLTASDGAATDFFGRSVAIASDTIVVGADLDDVSGANQGSAYVFAEPAGGWVAGTETAKLTASDGAEADQFGYSVAIASDTIVVGAYRDDIDANFNTGSAYVFAKPAGDWATGTETAKLTASDGADADQLGFSVAIASDKVVVGAPTEDPAGQGLAGSAYVFTKPAEGWATGTESAKFTASDRGFGDEFGISVGIAGDTIVAGAHGDDFDSIGGVGSAYAFEFEAPPPATVSIANASGTEGDSGTTDLTFTVSRSGDTSGTSSVDYAVDDGTATAGSDYVDESGTVTFAANDTSETITISVNGDLTDEADETFFVSLSAPTNATLSDDQANGTIENDDDPTLSIADVSSAEGHVVSTDFTFTVTRSGDTSGVSSVDFATANGTATAASDYTASSGTLTFAANDTSETITVSVNGDLTDEPDETFTVTLSNPANATLTDGSATGTIEDDDPGPAFTITDESEDESAGTATFTVTRSGVTLATTTVDYTTANDTTGARPATAGTDYTATSGTLTFGPTETEKTFTVAITSDTVDELDETFLVNLSNASNATIDDAQATGTITDDDTATISVGDATFPEGNSGSASRTFAVTLSTTSDRTVTVGYRVTNGTATSPADYTASAGTLSFAPGDTSKTITVSIKGDTLDEPDETLTATLSNPVNATITDGSATGTITDDDVKQPPVARITASTTSGVAALTVQLDGTSSRDPDGGSITRYEWSLGDGRRSFASRPRHVYNDPGAYTVTLRVTDDEGATATRSIRITVSPHPRYAFAWRDPVKARPTVNIRDARGPVPVTFTLGGNHGLDVLMTGWPTSQRFDCSTGRLIEGTQWYTHPFGKPGLSYNATTGTYSYRWETRWRWQGTCREFQIRLNDTVVRTARFRFQGPRPPSGFMEPELSPAERR